MTKRTEDELRSIAFRRLHDVSEALKAEIDDPAAVWALMFAVSQDLQAADLGMGSSAHEEALAMQREYLVDALNELRSPAPRLQ
jgi:hypothetical protein